MSHRDVAEKLLSDGLYLTALELHTELLESGREIDTLRDFFAKPSNFVGESDGATVSPTSTLNISRSRENKCIGLSCGGFSNNNIWRLMENLPSIDSK